MLQNNMLCNIETQNDYYIIKISHEFYGSKDDNKGIL